MSIKREQLARLERDASSMGTANHGRYVSEAMLAMRDPAYSGDAATNELEAPLRALKLLDVMWGGVFAKRPDQRVALNEVGTWLETRIGREPRVAVKVLLTELGWLKRLAKHHEGLANESGRPVFAAPGRGDQKSFGRRVAEIERKRKEGLAAAQVEATKPKAVVVQAPPPPTVLPAVFQARFVNFADAREARKTARKRQEAGKQPKERLLAVCPTDPALVPLAAGLVCSMLETSGLDAVFLAAERADGAEQPFYATAVELRADKRLVLVVTLVPSPR